MRRLSEVDGERVISRDSAEQVGTLRHVVIDASARRIVALHVDGRRKKSQLVDWGAITGFGPDAIVVESEDALRPPAEGRELEVASGKLDLNGRLALSDGGDSLGAVTDIEFDEASGAVERVVTDHASYDGARLRAIGPYCVILRGSSEDEERPASPSDGPS
jgi:uncharacterized protein YrrD